VLVWEATLYVRMRYGVDLTQAQPSIAVKRTAVPILLIHGAADFETLPKHSQEIADSNKAIQLRIVPRAFTYRSVRRGACRI
jgi:pimeloyl-ACP methyl ester carboxylesterase